MNRQEAIKLLALIKVAYPSTYKDMDDASKNATVNMWHSTFSNVPYVIMEIAFDHFRRVSKFAPTPADMFDELKSLYYRAVGDALRMTDNDSRIKQVNYVIEQTSQFRGSTTHSINYGMITDKMLGAGTEQKYLSERK